MSSEDTRSPARWAELFPGRSFGKASIWLLLALVVGAGVATRFLVPTGLTQRGPIVWVVSNLTRVPQQGPPGKSTRIELWAARGEYEPLQVGIQAPAGGLTKVNVAITDLTGPDNRVISRSDVTLYREHYIFVDVPSPARGSNRPRGRGWYPDGLIPFADSAAGTSLPNATLRAVPFDLPAGRNQPIWLDLYVPRDARPGDYRGNLTVTSEQGQSSVQIVLHVWNFELPSRPSLQSAFGIYNDTESERKIFYADDPANQELLLRHRLMPTFVTPAYERAFIDRLGLNIAAVGYFDHATYGNCRQPPAPSVAEFQARKAQHQPDLRVYVYLADEVTECEEIFPTLKEWARNAHAAGILRLITAVPLPALLDDGSGSGRSVADTWVLLPKQFVSNPEGIAAARRKGDTLWSYTASVQDDFSPKWQVDFDPINYRILGGFLNQSMGLQGLLYWAVNSWAINPTRDPWNNLKYVENGRTYGAGEGWLVYPGQAVGIGGFAPSMRLKWIRESVEDYEYIEILKRHGRGEWALEVARRVAPNWKDWTRDAGAIESARRQLGEEIERLLAQSSGPAQRR